MSIFNLFKRNKTVEEPPVEEIIDEVVEERELTTEEKIELFKNNIMDWSIDIPVYLNDGTVKFIPHNTMLINDENCFAVEGGKTYHTIASCYHRWLPEQRENFEGWELITLKEARSKKQRGLKKCSFCSERERTERRYNKMDLEDVEVFDDWDD